MQIADASRRARRLRDVRHRCDGPGHRAGYRNARGGRAFLRAGAHPATKRVHQEPRRSGSISSRLTQVSTTPTSRRSSPCKYWWRPLASACVTAAQAGWRRTYLASGSVSTRSQPREQRLGRRAAEAPAATQDMNLRPISASESGRARVPRAKPLKRSTASVPGLDRDKGALRVAPGRSEQAPQRAVVTISTSLMAPRTRGIRQAFRRELRQSDIAMHQHAADQKGRLN